MYQSYFKKNSFYFKKYRTRLYHQKVKVNNRLDLSVISISGSATSSAAICVGLVLLFSFFICSRYYAGVQAAGNVVVAAPAAVVPENMEPGLNNHPVGRFSKIWDSIISILGSMPPWAWFIFLVLLILFFSWLKKFLKKKFYKIETFESEI